MSLKDKLLGENPEPLEPTAPSTGIKVNAPVAINMQDRIRQANKLRKQQPMDLSINSGSFALLLDDSGSMNEIGRAHV